MRKVVVDLRPQSSYDKGHLEGAFSFPWENMQKESCGLPPRDTLLTAIVDEETDAARVSAYLSRFNYAALEVRELKPDERTVRHPPEGFPWVPNPFLVRVLPTILENGGGASFALDVGSGTGRDMVFLASQGWHAVGIENRWKLVEQGLDLAQKHGVAGSVAYVHCTLKSAFPVRSESIDLLHVCRFLCRPSLQSLVCLPRRGGYLVYSHFLEGCQRTEVGHPSSPAGFFERGELRAFLENSGYAVLLEEETALPDSRPFVNVLARRVR
uniref:Rhodanese domain-containing protein n=1 Tax=Trypanosoma congolense (strain IL3000) TaxID=1068625 RepID=G0UY04_TRYCI|nr:conserved hypothetical protein [Trypanosoma congolense IL3000]